MAQVHRDIAQPSGWVGMVVFGGLMMIVAGTFHAMAGLVGLFNDSYWLVPSQDLVVTVDYTTWGFVHLVIGVLAIAAGAGILAGQAWARATGVVLAVISALVNIAFLAAFPLWAMLIIALDVLVIYALVAHGKEVTT
ncbi:MAG TPA: hypothetical protein VNP20_03095 [Nocardioidaceae bacterium]|jgi:hypothetical protein|nr:hypothetical protein [Nocardioidaceae bacterium]